MSIIQNIIDAISNIFGASKELSKIQKSLIDWRTSDESIEYYKNEENKIFYNELENGDSSISDSIRKKKQTEIENSKMDGTL